MTGLCIQLLSKSNQAGLTRDIALVAEGMRLCGCNVVVTNIGKFDVLQRRSPATRSLVNAGRRLMGRGGIRYDMNVMIEHVWPQFLRHARKNIIIPNPEWFDRRDMRLVGMLNAVLAKTKYTAGVFEKLGCMVDFIGFDSEDRYDDAIVKRHDFLHLAGHSKHKGTARLLQVWRRHPEWPRLIVVKNEPPQGELYGVSDNIEFRIGHMTDPELRQLQNRCRFHLCLSEAEGWGHYIAESLGCAAVTITVDAPPMNELVCGDRGVVIPCVNAGKHHLSDIVQFDCASLEQSVDRLHAAGDAELDRIGMRARQWFLENKHGFVGRLQSALERLDRL